MFDPGTFITTSNAVREEFAIERPVAAGLRSRDEDRREWWGLTNSEAEARLDPEKRKK